jgi:hypothetical protein
MDIDEFWKLIAISRQKMKSQWDQHAVLEQVLQELPAEEIVSFGEHYYKLRSLAYRWDLWAVAYIIEGGCSDDGFMDFRAWLVAQGQEFFEASLKNPEHVGTRSDDGVSYEAINYVSWNAYEKKTGTKLPRIKSTQLDEPSGTRWDEDDLPKLYPELCKRFM